MVRLSVISLCLIAKILNRTKSTVLKKPSLPLPSRLYLAQYNLRLTPTHENEDGGVNTVADTTMLSCSSSLSKIIQQK